MCHHAQLSLFVFLVEMGFHHVRQNGLDLLTYDPPVSASQSAGSTGVSHCIRPPFQFFKGCLKSWALVSTQDLGSSHTWTPESMCVTRGNFLFFRSIIRFLLEIQNERCFHQLQLHYGGLVTRQLVTSIGKSKTFIRFHL